MWEDVGMVIGFFPLIRVLLGLDTAGDYKTRRLLYPNLKVDDSQFTFFCWRVCY